MGNTDPRPLAIGFLTVVEHADHGLFGGYLVLNEAGRPLEFHCTAPIKPSRAQQILYGPTLEPFLYGEQIGRTLLSQAAHEPAVVCTDCPPVLAVRGLARVPVALVLGSETDRAAPAEEKLLRIDGPHRRVPKLVVFQLGANRLAVPERSADDRQQIAERLSAWAEPFDLAEPFQRIREAIEEAQQAVR